MSATLGERLATTGPAAALLAYADRRHGPHPTGNADLIDAGETP